MTPDRTDEAEAARMEKLGEVNSEAAEREALEKKHGQVWTTEELQRDFVVEGFLAPFVVVRRRSDGTRGSLSFQHSPRYYFGWVED